jgi:hypothetical protein
MRTWFLKLRISATIDAGKPLSPGLQQKVARSPEAARFAETALTLDHALGQSPVQPEAPAALHDTIMRAVHATERQPPSPPILAVPLRFAIAGAAVVGIALLWAELWRVPPPATPAGRPAVQALAAPPSAADLGQLVAQTVPVSVVSPLADEFEHLGQDLDRTENFLLASLP